MQASVAKILRSNGKWLADPLASELDVPPPSSLKEGSSRSTLDQIDAAASMADGRPQACQPAGNGAINAKAGQETRIQEKILSTILEDVICSPRTEVPWPPAGA